MKKETKKKVAAAPVEEVKKTMKKKEVFKYHLSITVNENTHEVDTNDIFGSMIEFEYPPFIKTDVVFRVTEGDKVAEQVVGVFKGRRTFQNNTALKLMAINLTKQLG